MSPVRRHAGGRIANQATRVPVRQFARLAVQLSSLGQLAETLQLETPESGAATGSRKLRAP